MPAAVLGALAALVLAGATAAAWTVTVAARDVAGLALERAEPVAGTVYAPLALPLAIAGLLAAGAVGVLRGRARRAGGAVLALMGLTALVVVGMGLVAAVRADGALQAAPAFAAAGAAGIAVVGARTLWSQGSPAARAERYTVEATEADPDDEEWTLAADEHEAP